MMPIVSRSTIFRTCKGLFKRDSSSYDAEPGLEAAQKKVDEFLDESEELQETLENDFFNLMVNSNRDSLEFVKAIGRLDPELPGKNQQQFDQMLDYFWDSVDDMRYCLEDVLHTLSNAFPNYERAILKSAYLAFTCGVIEPAYELATLLEWMADYDEIDGRRHFSSDVDKHLPVELEEPIVNVCNSVKEIVELLVPISPIYDVVWILENRFGVDGDYLEDLIFQKFCEFYTDCYSISYFVAEYALEEFFKFPEGLKMFLVYLPNVMREFTPRDLELLERKYMLHIDIEGKVI